MSSIKINALCNTSGPKKQLAMAVREIGSERTSGKKNSHTDRARVVVKVSFNDRS